MRWVEKSLDELGSVNRGRSRHRPRDAEHLYGGPHPFIQTGDVKHAGLYLTKHEQTYSEAGLAQSKLWKAGTLCITIAANIAETSILGIDACFPDSVIGFVANDEIADARFVKYMFDATLKHRYRTFSQGVAQDNLSQEKLLSIKFQVPENVNDQRKIADILAAYDEMIDNNRRRIELLEQSARLLFKEWFVRLRYPGHERDKNVRGVPRGWERLPLGEVLTLQRGFDLPVGNRNQGDVPVYASTGIIGFHDVAKAKGPGVITGRSGSLGTVIYSARDYWPLNTALWVKVFKRVGPLYAKHLLEGLSLQQMNGGAAVPTLNRNDVHRVPVLVPTAALQDAYDNHVSPLFAQIDCLAFMNEKLAQARNLLLSRLMDGSLAI